MIAHSGEKSMYPAAFNKLLLPSHMRPTSARPTHSPGRKTKANVSTEGNILPSKKYKKAEKTSVD